MAGRILVLDDEENYAEMLQDLLRENNYRVDMATRPERAIDQLEEIPYDLVISDYKMPVMDGADFLKKARELYPNLPFILVSGLMNTPELVKVANMSVTLVMEKPLDTEAFLAQVARFSDPMTPEEKEAQANEIDVSSVENGESVSSYPSEPRFFSAVSASGKRFMLKLWSISNQSKEIFILDSGGGDGELAVKDLSGWRGNGDLPVNTLTLPETKEAALEKLRLIFSEFDQSNTVCIRISDGSQIRRARMLTESAAMEIDGTDNMLLVYLLEAENAATFLPDTGDIGVVLPALKIRPSDVASYARRFAKIGSERSGMKRCSEFTPEAAYLVLSNDWPGGYKQVQEAVMGAVKSSDLDEPLTAELLQDALGIVPADPVSPDARLQELMKRAQSAYFDAELAGGALTVSGLAENLELDPSIQTRAELDRLPLVKRELGTL